MLETMALNPDLLEIMLTAEKDEGALNISVFYAMSVVLYPRNCALRTFEEVRKPLYVTIILYALPGIPYYEVGEFIRPSYYWYSWISTGLSVAVSGCVEEHWTRYWQPFGSRYGVAGGSSRSCVDNCRGG